MEKASKYLFFVNFMAQNYIFSATKSIYFNFFKQYFCGFARMAVF